MPILRKITMLAAFLIATLSFSGVTPTYAEPSVTTFTVNSELDEADAAKADGACISTPSGLCTLRAAVMQANGSGDANTIVLQNAATYNLTLGGAGENFAATGDLDILYDVTITGAGVTRTTIDGNDTDRIFHISNAAANVKVSNLTLRDGNVGGGTAGEHGGGIANVGKLLLTGVRVTSNTAVMNGGGIYNLGGDAVLVDSTVSDNTSKEGAGIYNALHGNFTVLRSAIQSNHAARDGGGIYIESGDAIMVNTTVSSNLADLNGGGISMRPDPTDDDTLKLFNVTVAFNRADADDDGSGQAAGMVQIEGMTLMKNTIFAQNRVGTVTGPLDDCYGNVSLLGYNLMQQPTIYCSFQNDNATNKKGIDPKLGALANNGGPTFTHALLAGSPAIDAGNPDSCKDQYNSPLTQDQRGEPRNLNGNGAGASECDMGALEYNPNPTPTPTPVLCAGKPAAPSLASPANNAQSNSQKVQLAWNDVSCATKYKVLVRQDSKTGPKVDKKKVMDPEYKTKMLAKGHSYFWSVKACNTFGCKASQWWKVKVP